MPRQRHWLDWNGPCLPAAAAWLCDQAPAGGRVCRLDDFCCVTPGRRAGRLLLEHLLTECESRGLHLVPPRTLTPGAIIPALAGEAQRDQTTASPNEITFAWVAALRATESDVLAPVLAQPPEHNDLPAWHELAVTIERLHDELAGQHLHFTDAAEHAARLELFGESERWNALAAVCEHYGQILAEQGLVDRHEAQHAALDAAQFSSDLHLVLIGTVELNAMQRVAIDRVQDQAMVTALIHAPQSLESRFDAIGCIQVEQWLDAPLPLRDDTIVIADRPADQAQAALHHIASFDGAYAGQQITIGLGDPALAQTMQHAAAWAELPVHAAEGRTLKQSLPARLLEAVATWLSTRRFADFAALLRHVDLEHWLIEQLNSAADDSFAARSISDWIALLDRYFSEHLHEQLTGSWLGGREQQQRLKAVYDAVNEWLSPLSGSPRPIGQWAEAMLSVLRAVYGSRSDLPWETREACLALRDMAMQFNDVHDALQPAADAATALRLMLRGAANVAIADASRSGQIEMLGWLELHLDTSPALVVLGINDGNVPGAVNADAFLPDNLRSALGLLNNAQRYARDAYLLQAINNSRQELTIIAGRTAADGEPLAPSRLLLACEAEQLPQRVEMLCGEGQLHRWPIPIGSPTPQAQCLFDALPQPPQQFDADGLSMRVTDFKTYLSCPYRYWLRRIEGLQSTGDDDLEMDPLRFGSLAHSVLESFGRNEQLRDSTDADAIAAFLNEQADERARKQFGRQPAPAVRVQLARLKRRLDAFAACQAEMRREGWVIKACEFRLPADSRLDIPGESPVRIRGIIDRIDKHEATGKVRLIDYKTSEAGDSPCQVHHGTKTYKPERPWLDLQLPLYHFLAAQRYESDVEIGYIVLPKEVSDVSFIAGPWDDEALDDAIETARDVVRNIRAGSFEPNPDFRSTPHDEFAVICRTNVLGGDDDDDNSEGNS